MKSPGVLQYKTPLSLASKRLFAIFVVAGLVLLTYVQMTHSDARADARRTVIFMGFGGLDDSTASQPLSGTYQANWKTKGACSYRADLNAISMFSAEGATTGTKKVYSLPSDTYHVHMMTSQASDCAWQITFNPS